jgi:hypothetical protein
MWANWASHLTYAAHAGQRRAFPHKGISKTYRKTKGTVNRKKVCVIKKWQARRDTAILIRITKYCGICSAEQRKIANKGFALFSYICLFWPKKSTTIKFITISRTHN